MCSNELSVCSNELSVYLQIDILKKRGDDGWELVCVTNARNTITFYWKTEVSF